MVKPYTHACRMRQRAKGVEAPCITMADCAHALLFPVGESYPRSLRDAGCATTR